MRTTNFFTTFAACFFPILLAYYPLLAFAVDRAKDGAVPAVTVWLALSPSTKESGCLECIPGTDVKQLPHVEGIGGDSNALSLGQKVAQDELTKLHLDNTIAMELQPGEASMHSFWTVHASRPNNSSYRRVGLALRYVRADAKRKTKLKEFACRVSGMRGSDEEELFEQESQPRDSMGKAEREHHAEVMKWEVANYFSSSRTKSEF